MHPALCLLALIWDDDEDLDKGYYCNGWRFYSIGEIFNPRLPLSSYLRFVWPDPEQVNWNQNPGFALQEKRQGCPHPFQGIVCLLIFLPSSFSRAADNEKRDKNWKILSHQFINLPESCLLANWSLQQVLPLILHPDNVFYWKIVPGLPTADA